MKFSEQLLYRTHAGDCFFLFSNENAFVFGKDFALYCLIGSRRYFIQMTII